MNKCGSDSPLLVIALSAGMLTVGLPWHSAFALTCPGPNDAFGPCSDPHDYHENGGGGFCGECTDYTKVYIGGSCSGGGEGAYDCNDCTTTWKTMLQEYESTPESPFTIGVCYYLWEICLIYDAAGGLTCAAACGIFSGVYGASFCGSFCATVGYGFCDCLYNECIEVCNPVGPPSYSGSENACS